MYNKSLFRSTKNKKMEVVIFEVIPAGGQWDNYLAMADQLKAELNKIEGFISIERFQSITNKEKVLSLSFWENEESVKAWRNMELHREAQKAGRSSIFADYRLRVANVKRDYSMTNRKEVPADSKIIHDK